MSEPPDRRPSQEAVTQLVRSVLGGVLLAAEDLPWCEHGRADDGFGHWCSVRPDTLMRAFCFGAAQALAAPEDFRCVRWCRLRPVGNRSARAVLPD